MRYTLIVLAAAVVVCLPGSARGNASDADAACRAAMAPYYAALLASARGDADGTLRQVIVLRSRWDEVMRRPEADIPGWLRDTSTGAAAGAAVGAKIDSARQRLPRDLSGVHADLEAIRGLLRDARTRHGARTMDDEVTDYHEAMERLSSHIGGSNEIVLAADDFTTIGKDVERARSAWAMLESSRELARPPAGWKPMAAATASVLATIAGAADRRDATAAQAAARALKSRYYDLLTILSHRA